MATDAQSLYEQAKCYVCFGVSEFEALELALLANIVTTIVPSTGSFRITESNDFRITESGDFRIIE